MANRCGNSVRLYFWGALKSLQMVTAAMKLKDTSSLEGKLWPTWQHIKKQRHHFVNKGLYSQGYGFSRGHVCMWELDYKESWAQKNWCFWTVVLEKTLESPLYCKRSNQSILFFCSEFCHTLTWINHGFTCIPHPDTPSHLPLHLIPLGLPRASGPSTCLMHPAWAGDLFHPR